MLKRWTHLWVVAACAAVCTAQAARADDSQKEYLVKAAFLYNFVKFIEWPGDKAIGKQSHIDICMIGGNPFGASGQEVFARASTPSLKLSLVEKNVADASSCHLAFISRAEEPHLAETLAGLKNQPVLTVSDIDGFATKGGMVGFVTQDNKIKLEVNTANAAAASLRVDAQLLEIALRVIRN